MPTFAREFFIVVALFCPLLLTVVELRERSNVCPLLLPFIKEGGGINMGTEFLGLRSVFPVVVTIRGH